MLSREKAQFIKSRLKILQNQLATQFTILESLYSRLFTISTSARRRCCVALPWNGTIYQKSVRLLSLPWRISIEPTIQNRPKISQKSARISISQKSTCYTNWYTENTYRADDWESSNNFSKISSPFNFSNVGLLLATENKYRADVWESSKKFSKIGSLLHLSKVGYLWQFPQKMLHPRFPTNRETQISRYLAVQIQIEILVWFESVPRNLSCWIWLIWRV